MKKIKLLMAAALVIGLGAAAFTLSGCSSSTHSDHAAQSGDQPAAEQGTKSVKYACSMHPEVVQDKPGDCPKCGMKLTEKQ
jgi:Cu+-exporting ATPase